MTTDTTQHAPEEGAEPSWHLPVMLEETITMWQAPHGTHFVDGTVGNGGHTAELLSRMPGARVLGIDRDADALARAAERLAPFGDRVSLAHGSYAQLDTHLAAAGFPTEVDGILLDLGIGTHQLDAPERGFSFRFDGPLDMRFDQNDPMRPTAAELLQKSSEAELASIFKRWGEEPQARRAAKAIVAWRETEPIERTSQLVACLQQSVARPSYKKGKGGKKRTGNEALARCFQALRIAVNEELQQLDTFLEHVHQWLAPGGRIAVISFHSLEDRRIKHHLRHLAQGCICPPDMPVCGCGQTPTMRLLKRRGVQPSEEECEANSRARSARLRGAERVSS